MNIESHICHNALQLLVNKNDPSVFDNPDIFEKNLIENGASQSGELSALKQSLIQRVPWEIRKNAKNLTSTVLNETVLNFSQKSKVNTELATWAVNTWIAVLGLKKIVEKPARENIDDIVDQLAKKAQTQVQTQNQSQTQPQLQVQTVKNNVVDLSKTQPTVAFDQVKGRFGIVFGEDGAGDVKVFNTWYDQAPDSETSSLTVKPVKLESAPVKPFKTAPKRKKEKDFINKKKVETKTSTVNNSNIMDKETNVNVSVSPQNITNNYKPSPLEQKAYDLLNRGSVFANQALKILAPIAVGGSVLACRKMGEVYYKGYGVMQNFEAAHAWLKISAAKEDPESLFLMGTMYQFGMGVKQDIITAKQFFERAVKQGHSKSAESLKMINMGM